MPCFYTLYFLLMPPKEIEGQPWVEERPAQPEIPPETRGYLEQVETGEEIQLTQPVTDDGGAPLVSPTMPAQIAISLPLDSQQMALGLKAKVTSSFRWLAEWARRLIKKTAGKFVYKIITNQYQ